ncbi:MAG: hypothetical protein A2W68_19570 [Betaproteobacteria bacterium RIFCSPLOWO2_02_64_14]|nr:MAG: hypothetical protein A2W68_19570 [Betaproteobacteria bacterium RIFCSPLOWO2_02_64_14]
MHANVNTLLRGPLFERTFFYLRHGETEANRLGLITGATDIELNARGREQALAAVALVKALEVDAVYSSPLVVAHSGVFRVLCRALEITAPAAPIDNALPLRLTPPAAAGAPWLLERA